MDQRGNTTNPGSIAMSSSRQPHSIEPNRTPVNGNPSPMHRWDLGVIASIRSLMRGFSSWQTIGVRTVLSGALALLAAMPTPALAAQVPVPSIVNTNQFFIDDTHTPTGQCGNWSIDARTLTYSHNTKECRPSTEDPEGNWGLENRGLMCSARMVNRVIAIGDPILVMITLRNVGDVPVSFSRRRQIHLEFDYRLLPKQRGFRRSCNFRPNIL